MAEVEFVDRYSATGRAHPNPWTTCKHRCEGLGVYPMRFEEWEDRANAPALCPQRDENGEWEAFPPTDGYLFVWCEKCGGAGRRVGGRLGHALDILYTYWYQLRFPLWAMRHHEDNPTLLRMLKHLVFYARFIYGEQVRQRQLLRGHRA